MEQTTITNEQYGERYVPFGPWIVVVKLRTPEKIGSIIIPTSAKDDSVKFSMTGLVLAKSPFQYFENEYEQYVMSKISVGDLVGFSSTVPVISPAPPNISFDSADVHGRDIVTMHVGDVLGIWCGDDASRRTLLGRFA